MSNCPFCLGPDLRDISVADVAEEHNAVRRRVLEVFPQSLLLAALGPVVSPYLLFVPRRHIGGIREATATEWEELFLALSICLEKKVFPSGTLTIFEHGVRSDGGCSCVDHCHLHIVDGRFDLNSLIEKALPSPKSFLIGRKGFEVDSPPADYIWAGHYTSESRDIVVKASSAEGRGPQYFRRVLAALAKTDQWDWRVFPRWHAINDLLGRWN
ncbi:MAG: hypothetical protein JWR69_4627 [Pedosphaera sp.]|nr:hypothetical protein [Pedosphaera sp.]